MRHFRPCPTVTSPNPRRIAPKTWLCPLVRAANKALGRDLAGRAVLSDTQTLRRASWGFLRIAERTPRHLLLGAMRDGATLAAATIARTSSAYHHPSPATGKRM